MQNGLQERTLETPYQVGTGKSSYRFIKRAFDLFVALVAIVVLSPLLLIISAIVYLGDPGPVVYGQIRIGKNGKAFKMWKFRSMYIAFYATSFDSIALTASCYSYHTLKDDEQPNKGIQLMWCILLILLPIALLFAESSMNNLQSVSIVAAFPIGAVIVMIAASFLKDANKYMENLENKTEIK